MRVDPGAKAQEVFTLSEVAHDLDLAPDQVRDLIVAQTGWGAGDGRPQRWWVIPRKILVALADQMVDTEVGDKVGYILADSFAGRDRANLLIEDATVLVDGCPVTVWYTTPDVLQPRQLLAVYPDQREAREARAVARWVSGQLQLGPGARLAVAQPWDIDEELSLATFEIQGQSLRRHKECVHRRPAFLWLRRQEPPVKEGGYE